jgi:hypothetical protein
MPSLLFKESDHMKITVCAIGTGLTFLLIASSFAGILQEVDSLSAVGDIKSCEQALILLENECARSPESFDVHWRAARACRDYAAAIRYRGEKDWEKNSSRFGKKGMAYAEKAIALAPEKVEGHFYFAINVGIYADGVSILTALKEGLKGKTQNNLEKAYQIDKDYKDGGPAFALGRFWAVVPWPYQDKKKAMKYYREYQTYNKNNAYWEERTLDIAEFLIDDGKEYWPEARALLKKVTAGKNSYLAAQAMRLIDKIDGKK